MAFLLSCSEYDLVRVEFVEAITVDALEVGSTSAFLVGDIEGLRDAIVVECGFVLSSIGNSDSELSRSNQNSLVFLSTDAKPNEENRAFTARATVLSGATEYFFPSFVKIEGEEKVAYGGVDQFTTTDLSFSIESIRRTSEGCPTTAIVEIMVEGEGTGGNVRIDLVYSDDGLNFKPSVGNGIEITGGSPIHQEDLRLKWRLTARKLTLSEDIGLIVGLKYSIQM
jgi:hypothetical protein